LKLYKLLSAVTRSAELESEWLDLLSLLEYVGCRKIIKSVSYGQISRDVLRHISDEASHAFLLKILAERIGEKCEFSNRRLSVSGWDYFQGVDLSVSSLLPSDSYRAVSYIIEQRVLDVYPKYLELTTSPEVKRVLHQILSQEKNHGAAFCRGLFPSDKILEMHAIENSHWDRFLSAASLMLGI